MALLAKLRPMGPWRAGSNTGERSRAEVVLHSDALFSALTHAMSHLDLLDAWIAATADNERGSAVRFSSCFPYADQFLFVSPPRTMWPLPASLKVRWKSARFVPTSMVSMLLNGRTVREDDWTVDGPSECLLPAVRGQAISSPFRPTVRSGAAVDRLGEGVAPHRTACVEFHRNAGVWIAFDFLNEEARQRWTPAIQGALKLLADTGMGGGRSKGWGRFEQPQFSEGRLSQLLFGKHAPPAPPQSNSYWLLSLFSPADRDRVDWTQGSYEIVLRNGRVDSRSAASGSLKKSSKLVAEGSVLIADAPLTGMAHNVAPAGFDEHPVYRAGFALALPLAVGKKVEAVVEESTAIAEAPEPEPVPTSAVVAMSESEDEQGAPDVVAVAAEEPAVPIEAPVSPSAEVAIAELEEDLAVEQPQVEATVEPVGANDVPDLEPSVSPAENVLVEEPVSEAPPAVEQAPAETSAEATASEESAPEDDKKEAPNSDV
jgi:CRISPR type III-A-associated RAMP protein Csm4